MPATPAPAVAPSVGGRDRARTDLALLTGPPAGDLLAAVLAAEGVALADWAVHQVHHRPGVGVTVGWTVTWRLGDRTGEEYLLGTTAPVAVPAGASPGMTTARLDGRDVVVWRHPADPALPGLPRASSVEDVRAALGAGPGPLGLELVTYRPLRRAVLRVRGAEGERYLKVVRPHVADDLHARHVMLRAAGLPVAATRLLADGVLVLEALPGESLAAALAAGRPVRPDVVTGLLDALPGAALDLPRRPSPADRVRHHAAAAAAVLPDRADEVTALADAVTALLAARDEGPDLPTHGDLNPANLLLAPGGGDAERAGAVVGLLDVDTLGPGRRADDLAGLLGHLSVLPVLAPETYSGVPALLGGWTRAFEAQVDPAALHARAAAVVLSLVAGAAVEAGRDPADVRAQALARLAVARRWCASARALAGPDSERPLIRPSCASHPRPRRW